MLETVNPYGHLLIQKIFIEIQLPYKPGPCYPGHTNKQDEHNRYSGEASGPANPGSHDGVRNRQILIDSFPFELNKNLRSYENVNKVNKLKHFISK